MTEPRRFTVLQQFFLVTLRVAIGWHFLYEGLTKLRALTWSSEGYLAGAQGPLSGLFHTMADHMALARVAAADLPESATAAMTLSASGFGWVGLVDPLVSWTLILTGLGLMLGLFTRLSCLGAAFLLMLFYVTAPGWSPYGLPQPFTEGNYLIVTKNLIELIAVLAVFVFPTGQMAGLDVLIRRYVTSRIPFFARLIAAESGR